MRILHITDEGTTHPIRVVNEARAQQEAGVDVHVLTMGVHSRPEESVFADGVQHEHVQLNPRLWKFKALAADCSWYDRRVGVVLKDVIERVKPDVLHVHNIYLFGGVYRSVKSQVRPLLILDIAENIPQIMKSYDHVNSGLGKLLIRPSRWRLREEWAIRHSDIVVFVTEEAAADALVRTGDDLGKVVVMSNLVWPDSIGREGDPLDFPDGVYCLYFGDTSMRRGMESMLSGFDLAAEDRPDLHLIVVGFNRREQEKLVAIRNGLVHAERVHVEGFRSMRVLGHYLDLAAVGVCPILRNVHHDTTHANKLFQYMYGGLPMLVSDCPSQVSLVRSMEAGIIHRAGDAQDFAEKLLELLGNRDDMRRMGEAGRRASRGEWSWPAAMNHCLDRIKEGLRNR